MCGHKPSRVRLPGKGASIARVAHKVSQVRTVAPALTSMAKAGLKAHRVSTADPKGRRASPTGILRDRICRPGLPMPHNS